MISKNFSDLRENKFNERFFITEYGLIQSGSETLGDFEKWAKENHNKEAEKVFNHLSENYSKLLESETHPSLIKLLSKYIYLNNEIDKLIFNWLDLILNNPIKIRDEKNIETLKKVLPKLNEVHKERISFWIADFDSKKLNLEVKIISSILGIPNNNLLNIFT